MTERTESDEARFEELFVEITGETTLQEQQQRNSRTKNDAAEQSRIGSEELSDYVVKMARDDGLDDAVDEDGASQ